MQVVLLTAHLKRNDISFWIKSGQLALEQHDPSLAVRCYSKGMRLVPTPRFHTHSTSKGRASILCVWFARTILSL